MLNHKIKREDVNLYYVVRDEEGVRVIRLMLDEKGRPIISPDVRDMLREFQVEYLDRI
jgi:hypothetical protein